MGKASNRKKNRPANFLGESKEGWNKEKFDAWGKGITTGKIAMTKNEDVFDTISRAYFSKIIMMFNNTSMEFIRNGGNEEKLGNERRSQMANLIAEYCAILQSGFPTMTDSELVAAAETLVSMVMKRIHAGKINQGNQGGMSRLAALRAQASK